MMKIENLCKAITAYENELAINIGTKGFNEPYIGVSFEQLISEHARRKTSKIPFDLQRELIYRIDDYATYGFEYKNAREMFRFIFDAMQTVDIVLGTDLVIIYFNDSTPDQIADELEEEELCEREESERLECIDFCAKLAYNEGLFETFDEAYEVAGLYF